MPYCFQDISDERRFLVAIYSLVLGISSWLLEDNDINVESIFVLKKWNHNNVARFAHIVL